MKPGIHPVYGSHPCHPGAARVLDAAGRVERFERRYGAR
ncbi:50S ribosomal protein L31 [Streptomyces sp. NPDC057271]